VLKNKKLLEEINMTEAFYPVNEIVVATDFSANGDLAVQRAAQIAQNNGKTLHLLHVVRPLEIYPELMLTFDSHLKDYERLKHANGLEVLDEMASTIQKTFNITVKTATSIGRPHVEIAEFAKKASADLLVIGFKGEKNILDIIMGSTAFRLLRIVDCAVLIVRNAEVVPYKQIVAAVDLTTDSINVPAIACSVAPNAQIEMLHVFDLKYDVLNRDVETSNADMKNYHDQAIKHINFEMDKMVAKLDEKRISSMVINGYLPESISTRASELNADLMVLGKKNKTSLQEFILGSVSKTVASMVNFDVLLT
jgi:nucleotide-binding universal stress UspA family protein